MPTWKNQYIDLIPTKPSYLVSLASADELAAVRDLLCSKNFTSIVVELGTGSGGHLVEQAQRAPEVLHLGFELRYKRAFKCAEKAEQLALDNVLVVRGDARSILELFTAESLTGFYVNFPDPWEKRRWRKHRLLNPQFLEEMTTRLKPNGFISYKSDHPQYFEETRQLIESMPSLRVSELVCDLWQSECSSGHISSEFEKLFRSKNIPVHYLRAIKLAASS